MKTDLPPGPVMLDIAGLSVSPEERELLACPATGGLILFSRNHESPEQLAGLVASLRKIRPRLLVAVDHEGGRVQRFREGFTRIPPAALWETRGDTRLAEKAGWVMASELRAIGIDFSFAPVLDVECGISQVIGDRAFSRQPEKVQQFALAFAQGMRRAGMAAVGKHFPGHGSVVEDSHLALPVDDRPLADIEKHDLLPFRHLIGSGIEGIMPAHVIYRAVDERPTGFSPIWLRQILREKLGFDGAIFSDDLSMAGAAYAGNHVDRAHLALEAGCDMILACNAPEAAGHVVEALSGLPADPQRTRRLERMRGRPAPDRHTLEASEAWQSASREISELARTPS